MVIILSALANLASVGTKITVEKDWLVVIAGDNEDRLAKMNSIFRTIDLTCMVLSPTIAGFIFDYVSTGMASVAIGCWNIVSVFFEYYFLKKIYDDHRDLTVPKTFVKYGTDEILDESSWIKKRITTFSGKKALKPIFIKPFGPRSIQQSTAGSFIFRVQ